MDSQCAALVGPHHHDTARHVQQFSVLVITLEYRLCARGGVRCGLCRCNGPALQGVPKFDYLVNSLNGAPWGKPMPTVQCLVLAFIVDHLGPKNERKRPEKCK